MGDPHRQADVSLRRGDLEQEIDQPRVGGDEPGEKERSQEEEEQPQRGQHSGLAKPTERYRFRQGLIPKTEGNQRIRRARQPFELPADAAHQKQEPHHLDPPRGGPRSPSDHHPHNEKQLRRIGQDRRIRRLEPCASQGRDELERSVAERRIRRHPTPLAEREKDRSAGEQKQERPCLNVGDKGPRSVLKRVVVHHEADRPCDHDEDRHELDGEGAIAPDGLRPDREPARGDTGHRMVEGVPQRHPRSPQAGHGEERVEQENPPHRAHGGENRRMDLLPPRFGKVEVGRGHSRSRDEGDHEHDHPDSSHPLHERSPPLECSREKVRPKGHREAGPGEPGDAFKERGCWIGVRHTPVLSYGHEDQWKRTQRGHDEPAHRGHGEAVLEAGLARPAERKIEKGPHGKGGEGRPAQRPQDLAFPERDCNRERTESHHPHHGGEQSHVPQDDPQILGAHRSSR